MSRRVVITGLGVVAPNGVGLDAFEQALRGGVSGIRHVPMLDELNFGCRVAGVPQGVDAVTEEMFDQATSIHDFQEHWEQQAELIEQSMRMLWTRSQQSGNHEAYPGNGFALEVAGGRIELTPERWANSSVSAKV